MKKILFVLAILSAIVSCQKDDYRIEMAGTVWSSRDDIILDKVECHRDVTLNFLTQNEGIFTIEIIETNGDKESIDKSEYTFHYVYDYDLMKGQIMYDVPGYWGHGEHLESYFVIKSNKLYESKGIVENVEYRKI